MSAEKVKVIQRCSPIVTMICEANICYARPSFIVSRAETLTGMLHATVHGRSNLVRIELGIR